MEFTLSFMEFVKWVVIGFAVGFGWHAAAYLWAILTRPRARP